MQALRVGVCQLNLVVGDLDGNVERTLAALTEAESQECDLAIFPELTVCGYPPEDLLLKPGFVAATQDAVEKIAGRTGSCVAIVGFVDGHRELSNAAAVCVEGEIAGVYHKRLLPNYDVFDEMRYFTPGSHPLELFEIAGVRVGVSICEDAWSNTGPIYELSDGGAEVIVNLNASPYHRGKLTERESLLQTRANDADSIIVYANLVGGQDELVFDGASLVFDAEGRLVARGAQFEEQVLVVDLPIPEVRPRYWPSVSGWRRIGPQPVGRLAVVPVTPARAAPTTAVTAQLVAEPLEPLEEVWEALVLGTRDYVRKNGFSEVVIGMSGGIDSSIVAALAADALGPQNVHGVLMPSRFSSDHSVTDAAALADNLGIDHRVIEIESAHAALLQMLAPSFGDRAPDTTEENIQSRIRGVVLMALSNKFGWLVLTTGNKSESAVGYSTLYGDTAGGFAVIKDVPKMLVYDLVRWRNQRDGAPVVPEHVLTKPPSAELRPDQRDDQSLPPYELLDAIIERYVEDDRTARQIIGEGFDPDVVALIVRLIDLAEYKRRQTPPGIRISEKAFGRDRRLPITNRFRG